MKKKNIALSILLSITFIGCHKSTDLKITIKDADDYAAINDCHVRLYDTETDWENDTNPWYNSYTNSDGIVNFYDITPQVYYIDAVKQGTYGYFNNWDRAIKLSDITSGELNSYTIYVDYFTDKKGEKQMKIVRVEKK